MDGGVGVLREAAFEAKASATSIVASCACSFRLMRSRLLYTPLACSRSLTSRTLPKTSCNMVQ